MASPWHLVCKIFVVMSIIVVSVSCGGREGNRTADGIELHVVEVSGAEYDLQGLNSSLVRIQPLTSNIGGTVSLNIDLGQVTQIRQQDRHRIFTVRFRSGDDVSGRPIGHLEGLTDGLAKAIPWEQIQMVAVRSERPIQRFEPPDGPWLRVSGDGVGTLELFGVQIQTSWIVRHGTHAYRRDVAESESLPFTVMRERLVREEWEIPLGRLQRLEIMPYRTSAVVDLGSGNTLRLDGLVGGRLTQHEGDAGFVGFEDRGRFNVSLLKIHRAVSKAGRGRSASEPPATVTLELFGRSEVTPKSHPKIGRITDWDARELNVTRLDLRSLRIRTETGEEAVSPSDIVAIEVFTNPWEEYDEGEISPQWVEAMISLRDGSEFAGELYDRFGTLECRSPDGLAVHLPSWAVRSLVLDEY